MKELAITMKYICKKFYEQKLAITVMIDIHMQENYEPIGNNNNVIHLQ